MAVVPKSEREQLGLDPSEEEVAAQQAADEEARQQAELEAQQQTEQEQRPEWLPEKFKSVDDFTKSYSSLENELRERGNRERELTERLTALESAATQARDEPRGQADDPLAAYAEELAYARETGDTRREAELAVWLNNFTMSQAFQAREREYDQRQQPVVETQNMLTAAHVKRAVMERFDDFSEYEQQVGQLLQEQPWRMPDEVLGDPARMEDALIATYEAVKARDLIERQKELEAAGVTSADLQRARKISAQTLSGATGRPGEPSDADREIAEMRKALDESSWDAHISRPSQ